MWNAFECIIHICKNVMKKRLCKKFIKFFSSGYIRTLYNLDLLLLSHFQFFLDKLDFPCIKRFRIIYCPYFDAIFPGFEVYTAEMASSSKA